MIRVESLVTSKHFSPRKRPECQVLHHVFVPWGEAVSIDFYCNVLTKPFKLNSGAGSVSFENLA